MFLVNIIFPCLDYTFQLYWNQYNLFYLFWLSKRKQRGHMLFHIEALEQAGIFLFSWWQSNCNDLPEIVLSTKGIESTLCEESLIWSATKMLVLCFYFDHWLLVERMAWAAPNDIVLILVKQILEEMQNQMKHPTKEHNTHVMSL